MFYVTVDDFEGYYKELTEAERETAKSLLEEACIIVRATNTTASEEVVNMVVCRMVKRAMNSSDGVPMGTTQGSMSALGYTQSWTMDSNGSVGELYLSKLEKKMLGVSNRIGSHSPLEDCGND